jgi:Flp pilus assembly protein TadD
MPQRRYSTVERELLQGATELFYAGDAAGAARNLSFLTASHQDDASLHFNLAVCLAQSGEPILANIVFNQAVRLNPKLDGSVSIREFIVH